MGQVLPNHKPGQDLPEPNTEPTKFCELQGPTVKQMVADKESIQDYVAALFIHTTHVNMTVEYDDNNNLITFSVDSDISAQLDTPPDISDAINALDGAIN